MVTKDKPMGALSLSLYDMKNGRCSSSSSDLSYETPMNFEKKLK